MRSPRCVSLCSTVGEGRNSVAITIPIGVALTLGQVVLFRTDVKFNVHRFMQSRIQLKARQRAARKMVEERRQALRLIEKRKAESQRQAAIKIQAAAKAKHARVSDEDLLHVRTDPSMTLNERLEFSELCSRGVFCASDGTLCRPHSSVAPKY